MSTPSLYDHYLFKLKDAKCLDCYGSGVQDDLEPGDIAGREWTCPTCEGTGISSRVKRINIEIEEVE